jgi:hypothetical protein
MGSGITIICPKCEYKVDATLGSGFRYADLLSVINLVPPRIRKKVADILETHSIQSTEFCHELFVCPKCSRMTGRFYYRIEYDHGKVLESSYRCGHCRTGIRPYGKDMDGGKLIESIREKMCPQCHESLLETQEDCPWD